MGSASVPLSSNTRLVRTVKHKVRRSPQLVVSGRWPVSCSLLRPAAQAGR